MAKPKKGDRLEYVGPYALDAGNPYPPGTVVGFRYDGTVVTVLLDREPGETADAWADWHVDEVRPIP